MLKVALVVEEAYSIQWIQFKKKKKNIFQYESQWKISLSKKFKIGYYKYARND